MTRDEVRELIRDSVRDGIKTQYEKRPMSHDDEFLQAIAEAVLAAFAAQGIVLGTPESVDIEIDTRKGDVVIPFGFALVRVVE